MTKLNTLKFILTAFIASSATTLAVDVFKGKDGLVIIEAESTKSSKGKWKKKTTTAEFTGESHLEFTGNKPSNGPATSPLKYYFTVDKDGVYKLLIRAFKRLEGERSDLCNDCYVRLKGKFESGGKAPLKMLKSDTKLYGGHHEKWGWTAKLDEKHKKFEPLYKLKAGEKYTLIISGRSQRFNMDRIVLKHSSVADKKATDPKQPESSK